MNMREVIVTAGGLSEPIDSVRSITNTSTGALGALIADEFAGNGDRVTFVCPKSARMPQRLPESQIHYVTTARDTLKCIEALLREKERQIFIHAMAVSDFEVDSITPELRRGEKLSSGAESPVMTLKPTPKIIARVKSLQPHTHLVGFKLLSGVSAARLIEVADKLRVENHCDFVVANRLESITDSEHEAYFVDENGATLGGKSKIEIAREIVRRSLKWN
jgi:phosphopantothenate-cysteine ligase